MQATLVSFLLMVIFPFVASAQAARQGNAQLTVGVQTEVMEAAINATATADLYEKYDKPAIYTTEALEIGASASDDGATEYDEEDTDNDRGGAGREMRANAQDRAGKDTETATTTPNGFLSSGNNVAVSAVLVRGWDAEKKAAFMQTVKAHAQLQSEQDLENFATGILLRDPKVASVEADTDSEHISYKVPAKFLGMFATTIKSETEVTFGDGIRGRMPQQVKVRFPWYRFLYKVDAELNETALHAAVADAVTSAETSAELSTAARFGLVLKTLVTSLAVNTETTVDAAINVE